MPKRFLLLAGALSLISTLFAATESYVARNHLDVENIDAFTTRLILDDPSWELGTVELTEGTYQRIIADMPAEMRVSDAPHFPSTVAMVAVPSQGDLSVNFSYSNVVVVENVDLAPFQPVQLETEHSTSSNLQLDPEMANADTWYPQEPVILHQRAQLRDIAVAQVEITPFQYNPARREIRILEGLEVTLEHDEPLSAPQRPVSRHFEPIYRSVIPNYTEVMPSQYQTPSILFVIPNNTTVENILQPLVDWKREKGFEVNVANTSVTGSTSSSIKSYIQTAYDTWENPPEYIVLVGDVGGSFNIPTFFESFSGYGGEGDHPYVHLAGGDYISDAFVGRLTFASTSVLSNIVAKTLNYEKSPYMTDPGWFTRALLVGDPSSSGLSTIMTNRYIDEVTERHGYDDNILVFNGSFVSQISNGINSGVAYFNYRGYLGMSGWGDSNTNNLNNGPQLPFATILTCGTGSFSGTARSETFLRAGSVSVPKGAIGSVGTATTGTHTLYNNCVAGGMYQGIFNEDLFYMGQALERGRFNLNLSYPNNNSNYVQIFSHWNNLMGDPSTPVWTGVPENFNVDVPSDIPASSLWLTVTVTDDDGNAVEGAWVTALQSGNAVFSSDYSDADGLVMLSLAGLSESDITLTVTKQNFVPSQSTIGVDNETHAVVITDAAYTESIGNGDGIANSAETFEFTFTVSNNADTAVQAIDLMVSSEFGDTWSETLTSLDAGASFTSPALAVVIPTDYPGVADVDFHIEIAANGSAWSDHRRLEVIAPYLDVTELSEAGGGDASFDPGEITDLVLDLDNLGRGDATGLTGILRSQHPNVVVLDSTASFGAIASGDDGDNAADVFSLDLGSQLTVGVQAPISVHFTDASGYTEVRQLLLPIGTPTVSDPLGPDAGGYFCYDDQDLAYALAPIYNWIEIKPGEGGFNGSQVPLSDYGENQEDIHTVSLPFAFGFYGTDYNEIGVGSNGYISLGSSEQGTFRNWRIPGALGPSPMIAAFWDDLMLGGDAGVYTYYHSALHYFVIEWHEMINRYDNNTLETFQIVLYDGDYYGSTDGNGDIKIQYKEFNNVDQGTGWSSSHGNYASIGIENETATIGLEYSFNNTYPVQARVLSDNSALLFTTRTDAILPCPGWAYADVNHDGQRNVQDIIITINVLLGDDTFGECEFWAADMSGDSLLNVGDLVIMVNQIIGLGRSATGNGLTPEATFTLDATGLHLETSAPLGAFLIEIESEEEPQLGAAEGVTLVKSHNGSAWQILGYQMGSGIRDFQIAHFSGQQAEFGTIDVADLQGGSIEADAVLVPETFAVTAVYPNPFNPQVSIDYALPMAGEVELHIFNALGQLIYQDVQNQGVPGTYSFTWRGETLSQRPAGSGVYFARLEGSFGTEMVKLTLLK